MTTATAVDDRPVLLEAFTVMCQRQLPVCDDLILELDPNVLFRTTRVLDELQSSHKPAPFGLCKILGLRPGATLSDAVNVYRVVIQPRATVQLQPGRDAHPPTGSRPRRRVRLKTTR